MMGLTPLQSRALEAIRTMSTRGVPPSYRELQARLDLSSVSQVHRLLSSLEERGAISRPVAAERGRGRGIVVNDDVRVAEILRLPTPDLRALRDRINRELRRRTW
jgi:SOS-response transcriptional repressor LexA